MSSWISEFRGRPWRADAEGPAAYDCRGLVRAVQRRVWGREVPALLHPGQVPDMAAVRQACERQGWRPTAQPPEPGDIIVVRALSGPHVGVFVQADRRLMVLHAERSRGVRLNTLAELLACHSRPQVWRFQP